jgi:prepilin-type processing-associated H-X9-DG protein
VAFVFLLAIRPGPGISRSSTCQVNMKQIYLGFAMYLQDSDESFPSTSGAPAALAGRGVGYGWADTLVPYTKSSEIFQCPSENRQTKRAYLPSEAGYTDYYMNSRVARRPQQKLVDPGVTVLLGDGNDGREVNDARYALSAISSSWLSESNSPARRHNESANYIFTDGHIKRLPYGRAPGLANPNKGVFTFRP